MLLTIRQVPTPNTDFSGLTWALEETLLSVSGLVKAQGQNFQLDTLLDLNEVEAGPLLLNAEGIASFSQENALAHLGYWDGTDFTYIEHSAG